jgi:hypothetical protein
MASNYGLFSFNFLVKILFIILIMNFLKNQVYPAVPPADLTKRQLEVTVWHHQSDGRLEFLGEFLLDLAGK